MPDGWPTSGAVHEMDARVLLFGGPGSGKTTALIDRFASLVSTGVEPERIALFTLTSGGARRARQSIVSRLGHSIADLPVFTVHGFCFGLLGDRFAELGYADTPAVLSAAEQAATIGDLLAHEDQAGWPHYARVLGTRAFARDMAAFVLRAQEELLDPEDIERIAGERGLPAYVEAARFMARYLAAVGDAGRIDFGGLVQQAAVLLARKPASLFDHILIDDYQDATRAQENVLASIAVRARSVVVAADALGSVFSFRGAGPEPLARAHSTFGPLEEKTLVDSPRAGARAARALDGLAPDAGGGVETRLYPHPGEEAEGIAEELVRLRVDDDIPWGSIAVIVRRRSSFVTSLRHALTRRGVPHSESGEASTLAADPAVRPVLELFRYAISEAGRDERLEPLLSSPIAGFTPHDVRRLRREARIRGRRLREMIEEGEHIPGDLRARAESFRAVVDHVGAGAQSVPPDELFFGLWTRLEWFAGIVAASDSGDSAAMRALDALTAFGAMLDRFTQREPRAGIDVFLAGLDVADFGADPWFVPARSDDSVAILTPTQSHGRAFEVVFVASCLEGEFPSPARPEPLAGIDELVNPASPSERRASRSAEERRTFRLAVSRASRVAILCASAGSTARSPRTPSRFAGMMGAGWTRPPAASPPTSFAAIEASLRRTIADANASRSSRLAALAALTRIGAEPASWWGTREWTDPGLPMYPDEIRTSYSRLSPLDNCALQYLYQTEMGLDARETHQMWLGSIVHTIIERVHDGSLPRDPGAIVAALDAVWKPDVFGAKAIEHRRYLDAKDMLLRWLSRSVADPVSAEEAFEFELGGATIRGRIDAVFPMSNGHVRVVDYKTGRGRLPKAEDDLQLAAYYLAMLRAESLRSLGKPGQLELHFIAQERARDGYAQVRFSPATVDGYEEAADARITALIERMRQESFGPSPEADCMWCAFKTLCPLWPEGAEATAR